ADNSNFELTFVDNVVGIQFKTLTLHCDALIDKIVIFNSSGIYYPSKKEWYGNQGRINWERVGKPEKEIYCEFYKHKINMGTGGFTVDSAFLTYPTVSKTKLIGKLVEMISNS